MNENTTTLHRCCVKDVSKYYYPLYMSNIERAVENATFEWE